MRYFLVSFVIFFIVNLSDCQTNYSEFVTLWTPKFAQEDANYRVFLFPSNIDKKTEAAVQFRKSYATVTLLDGVLSPIEYKTKQRFFGNGTLFNVTMTLMRNITGSGSTVQPHCSTKIIPITPSIGNFYNFIQTDKSIYKPGDKVQLRVLTVDRDLKPFHRDNIEVSIIDPFKRTVVNFQNQSEQHIGVFTESFVLSSSTVLGDWKIKVVVDKKPIAAVYKTFAVQKYTLPLFEVHVDIDKPHLLSHHDVKITIYAKYSFGEFVTGNANLIIRDANSGFTYLNENIINIVEKKDIIKKLNDLEIPDEAKLEAFVDFIEPESGISFNKTAFFYVHTDTKYKLTVLHPEKFRPDFPYTVEVYLNNWKNEKLMSHTEHVHLIYSYKSQNGSTGTLYVDKLLNNGKFLSEFHIPNEIVALTIDVTFPNSIGYRENIPLGSVSIGVNKLAVGHIPKYPKLNENVKITVKSDTELDEILVAIITRHGNSGSKQVSCDGKVSCEFDIKITKQMMPQSTVMVYSVKNKQNIYQGKTTIETEGLSENYLQLKLSNTETLPRKNISMEFKTKPNSQIYVLAFDKRLKFLRDGNDFTNDDVIKTVADYDGENKIEVDDLTSWTICSEEELKRLQIGRQYVSRHSEGTLFGMDLDDDDSDDEVPISGEDEGDEQEKEIEEGEETTKSADNDNEMIRELFPETWIFDELKNGEQDTIVKSFQTPDSITTWIISAFSANKASGIAITPAQELIVKKEFFIKFNLPYSIRFTEVLRLDVLVFNYLKNSETIETTVTLTNLKGKEFEFVEYNGTRHNCVPSYNKNKDSQKKVTVPANSIRKVSFYIRSDPTNNEFDSKMSKKITIQASGGFMRGGKQIKDSIRKKLTVEPVGIKQYNVIPISYNLNGETAKPHMERTAYSEDLVRINAIATGDMLGSITRLNEVIQLSPYDCLEQRTSKFKRNADIYRYLKLINRIPQRNLLAEQLQEVRNAFERYYYRNDGWYRAHLIDALGTAQSSGLVHIDRSEIDNHFNYLKNLQISNGTFSNFRLKYLFKISGNEFTERFFSTAFALIPFLKHRALVTTYYGDVIHKAFDYLNKRENRLKVSNQAFSIAAYVYALDNKFNEAEKFLDQLKDHFIVRDNKKCFKLSRNNNDCDFLHTNYIALALLTMNKTANAEPLINWLIKTNLVFGIMENTLYNSILTEPIVKMGILKNSADLTNLKVKLRNEHGYEKTVEITKENDQKLQNIDLPKYSREITASVSGYGYCTVTIFMETIVMSDKIVPKFTLNIYTNIPSYIQEEKIVRVCATYNSNGSEKTSIVNVIYEVNMPSGYVYSNVANLNQKPEIKQVTQARRNTIAFVYFNDFKENYNYCVDIKATKMIDVKEIKAAGVKVYDYDEKTNVAVSFYKFESNNCE